MIPASRKLGRDDAAALARAAHRVVVSKGKTVTSFSAEETATDGCADAMLGPTGNLRAPTLRVGETVLVGFNEDVYTDLFGDP